MHQGLESNLQRAVPERCPDGWLRCGWILRPRNPDAWSRGQSVQRLNAGHLSARGVPRHRARDGLEGNRDGRKLRSTLGDRIVHGLEQQPCGVQVVEGVGLVASGFFNSS